MIFQLDNCLDFSDSEFIGMLSEYYENLKEELLSQGLPLPVNKNTKNDKHKDLVLRELDCAVIEYIHRKIDLQIKENKKKDIPNQRFRFDTVRGIFTEGGPAFEGAGIQAKNHIQVCIRNLNCIKGFFVPRKKLIKF